MLYGLAEVCWNSNRFCSFSHLFMTLTLLILQKYLHYINTWCIYFAKIMATSSTNKSAVSIADGKCIWQKQEATRISVEWKLAGPLHLVLPWDWLLWDMVREACNKEKKNNNILIGFTVKEIMGWEVCCNRWYVK